MALNAKKLKTNNAPRVQQPDLEEGTYPARLVQIIDFGIQPQRPFKGEEKPPAHEISFTYELADEFCVDEKGEVDEEKPRWVSETFPFRSLEAELAKSTKRYKALDPNDDHDGDFTALVDTPCNITLVVNAGTGKNAGKNYTNVAHVSAMRPKDAAKAPALVNPTKVFVLDEPDLTIFLSFPDWIQEKIKGNLKYEGSVLQKALEAHEKGEQPQGNTKPKGKVKDAVEEPVEAVEEDEQQGDDVPW